MYVYALPLINMLVKKFNAQVCPDVDETLLAIEADSLSSPLLAHMADSLAKIFLPPATTTSITFSKKPAKRCMLYVHFTPYF